MQAFKEKLHLFFFAPINPAALDLFRVVVTGVLFFAFWPRGLEPASSLSKWPGLIFLYDTVFLSPAYRVALFMGLLLFGLGFQTRTMGLLLLLMLMPHCYLRLGQVSRPIFLFTLFAVSLFPSRLAWSRTTGREEAPIWPIRLLQLLLTLIYGINALFKSTVHYLSGEALINLSAMPNFMLDLSSGYFDGGCVKIPVSALAMATVLIEYGLAFGFWLPKFRWITACVGVLFHFGLTFVVKIFMLDYATVLLYLAFLLPFARARSKLLASNGSCPSVG